MTVIRDDEFGDIVVRRSRLSRSIKLSIAPNGTLRISMPLYAPLFLAKRLVASSRASIRQMLSPDERLQYESGMRIGKSHTLMIVPGETLVAQRTKQLITLRLPDTMHSDHPRVRAALRPVIISSLKKEASSYLPKRLEFLAKKHHFSYESVRFSHASSRWGSCSSQGTISLNIGLMLLDFALIDYVLLHELCHTRHMNHSHHFWQLVQQCDPDYKIHRHALKSMNPTIF